MIKPIAEIHHKAGKRSIVYADDYERLSKYCDQLQLEKKALADQIGKDFRHSELFREVDKLKDKK